MIKFLLIVAGFHKQAWMSVWKKKRKKDQATFTKRKRSINTVVGVSLPYLSQHAPEDDPCKIALWADGRKRCGYDDNYHCEKA